MKKYKGFIALFTVLTTLFSFSAFATDTKEDDAIEEFVFSEERLERLYDPANYEDGNFEPGVVNVG
jgi:hypothetical protein